VPASDDDEDLLAEPSWCDVDFCRSGRIARRWVQAGAPGVCGCVWRAGRGQGGWGSFLQVENLNFELQPLKTALLTALHLLCMHTRRSTLTCILLLVTYTALPLCSSTQLCTAFLAVCRCGPSGFHPWSLACGGTCAGQASTPTMRTWCTPPTPTSMP
jgi:hypothetical protein